MPATWGYGAAGSEPMAIAGWGFLIDLPSTVAIVSLESATVTQLPISATVRQLGITATVTQYTVTAQEKNELS